MFMTNLTMAVVTAAVCSTGGSISSGALVMSAEIQMQAKEYQCCCADSYYMMIHDGCSIEYCDQIQYEGLVEAGFREDQIELFWYEYPGSTWSFDEAHS